MIYAARFDTMNALIGYLTENCCEGVAADCVPRARASQPHRRKAKVPA